jgi:hypothetical protein
LISVDLKFDEFKIEILNHIDEMINDENIFDFINFSVPINSKTSLGEFILLILKKFYSNNDNLMNLEKIDEKNSKFLLERSKNNYDFLTPKRLDFEKVLNEIVCMCYNHPLYSDFIIKSSSKTFHVHKNVLSNYDFFKNKFKMIETNDFIEMNEKSPELIDLFLKLLYNHTIEIPKNINDIIDLFDLIYKNELEVDYLNILRKLESFISMENFSNLFNICFEYQSLNYKQKEINDFWIEFYQKLINFIKKEMNNDLLLDLLFESKKEIKENLIKNENEKNQLKREIFQLNQNLIKNQNEINELKNQFKEFIKFKN